MRKFSAGAALCASAFTTALAVACMTACAPNYPDEADLFAELNAQPHVVALDVETLAKENNVAKSANVVLLGAAAAFLKILDVETLRKSVGAIFAAKGAAVIEANNRAFDIGLEYVKHLKLSAL